ncbi:hypothetical protein ANTRET_LOCUS3834 [Anthophora retusa]
MEDKQRGYERGLRRNYSRYTVGSESHTVIKKEWLSRSKRCRTDSLAIYFAMDIVDRVSRITENTSGRTHVFRNSD